MTAQNTQPNLKRWVLPNLCHPSDGLSQHFPAGEDAEEQPLFLLGSKNWAEQTDVGFPEQLNTNPGAIPLPACETKVEHIFRNLVASKPLDVEQHL